MDRKLRNHLRLLWVFLALLVLLCAINIALTYTKKASTVVENFVGEQGKTGQTVVGPQGPAGYTPIKGIDYFDGTPGTAGVQGIQGIQGETGSQGTQGNDGETGAQGPAGKSPEFRCSPNNHNYQWRYVGDEDWQTLQKNSQACQSAL